MAVVTGDPSRPRSRGSQAASRRWLLVYVLIAALGVAVVGTLAVTGAMSRFRSGAGSEDVRIPVLKNAVRANPDDINIRRELAIVYQQTDRDRAALKEYKKVLAVDENDIGALYGMGTIARDRGKDGAAREYFEQILALDPTEARASVALAELYLKSDETDKALAIALPAVDAHPDDADLHYLTALAFEGAGDDAKAIEHYRTAVELDPGMSAAREAMSRLGAQQ